MDWLIIAALLFYLGVLLFYSINRLKLNEIIQAESLSQKGVKVNAVVKEIKNVVSDKENKKIIYHLSVQYTVDSEIHQAAFLHEMDARKATRNTPKKGDCMEIYVDKKDSTVVYNCPIVPAHLKVLYKFRYFLYLPVAILSLIKVALLFFWR